MLLPLRHFRVEHDNFYKGLELHLKYLVRTMLCVDLMSFTAKALKMFVVVCITQSFTEQSQIDYMEPSASLYSCTSPQIIFLLILRAFTYKLHSVFTAQRFNLVALAEQEICSIHET